MALNLDSARVTDLDTTFDAAPAPAPGPDGPVIWATVKIAYLVHDMTPVVKIRVPVAHDPEESEDRRRAKALRCARELIDHACQVLGAAPAEPVKPKREALSNVSNAAPNPVQGIAQELGLAEATPG